ncbi:FAD/NAD(P)-binding domain-containing protein [Microthyrium microscopicum]|uniref:FAD/NAD(P)-binding domain-containing protein n=1 Tax=Microthyrium microscopicum TaxID=703497 RepID=A0A6A6U1E4_9PEZI|nr:FAD/NAD(P)-binding domain-containing protein [Microthyrium microscopicum]
MAPPAALENATVPNTLPKEAAKEISTIAVESVDSIQTDNIPNLVEKPKTATSTTSAPAAEKPSITAKLAATLPFSIPEVRAKYITERDKRLRPDGNKQYGEFKGDFAHYLDDPYIPKTPREPRTVDIDFLILGGGFGGLCLAAELTKVGVNDFLIVDKAGDFGGTWYWNRYPGAACDIESYIYLPLLEETGYIPSEKYVRAHELLAHCTRIGKHFDLHRRALFHTQVTSLVWDDKVHRWTVYTDRGDVIRARFAASASGPLNMPKLPGVPGVGTFKGHSFHTSRWDYAYTGGDSAGGLDKLANKRVGFIGTGATGVQVVPHLGAGVQKGDGKLFVFQRTPSTVFWRGNKKTDEEWAKNLKPGWQRGRQDDFMKAMAGGQGQDLVGDEWTAISRWMREKELAKMEGFWGEYGSLLELADMWNMDRARGRCESVVKDGKTAEALKPWYRQFCKRPTFHDEYLETFNLSNVELVDTKGQGVDRITEKGVVVDGKEYELDCLVYGTGFEVWTPYSRRSGFEVYGKNGETMTEKWSDGVRTLHGLFMNNFPNLFIMTNAQSAFTANFVHAIGRQAEHIAWIIQQSNEKGIETVEATKEAENAWGETIIATSRLNLEFQQNCTPGYYNLEGDIDGSLLFKRSGNYGLGPIAFFKLMEEWREKGEFEGLQLTAFEGNVVEPKTQSGGNGNIEAGEANGVTKLSMATEPIVVAAA